MNQSTRDERDGVWIPCGTCWGQRRLYTAGGADGRLTAHACPACMGIGERLSGGDMARARTL